MSTIALERVDTGASVKDEMNAVGLRARAAASVLARASTEQKNAALDAIAAAILERTDEILAVNATDVANGKAKGLTRSFVDRLTLTPDRLKDVAAGVAAIRDLPDPVGDVIDAWKRPNGLNIERVRTPLGVIGVIFESRPNVTVDAGALCLKAGNAAILRPGSDSHASAMALNACIQQGLRTAGLPEAAVQLVETTDRAAVGEMLSGLDGSIDVIVPRGGRSLVERVQTEARVPVFAHLDGICHVYVHGPCNLDMATEIAVNAKMRRTGICGAAETVLVDRSLVATHAVPIAEALISAGCTVRADADIQDLVPGAEAASEGDFGKEFLDSIIAMKLVDDLPAALNHIATYGSNHTDCILTDDAEAAETFLNSVESAIVLHNASTQFADGGEFGMGAEIGIATGRMHARGPVGLQQLTSFNYRVRGTGQTRP